ncbi:MAG: TolC family protein [Verrucomicrobiota bacterium]
MTNLMRQAINLCAILALTAGMTGCIRYEAKPLMPMQSAAALEARGLEDASLRQFLATNAPALAREWPRKSWDIESLTWAGWHFHSSIAVARAQYEVARAGIVTAGGRLNPVISSVFGYSATAGTGLNPWMPGLSLDVPIETAGKRNDRIEQARHASFAAYFGVATAAWQVRTHIRATALEWAAARKRQTFLETQLQAQDEMIRSLEQRVTAGALTAVELMPARVQRTRILVDLDDAKRVSMEALPRLADAIGLPARALQGVNISMDVFAGPSPRPAASLNIPERRQQVLQQRPEILAALEEYAATQASLQLEIARQYPDVHLSPGYQWDQGNSKWTLGMSLELPVLNQNQGPIAEAKARREAAAVRFMALQARVLSDLDLASASLQAAQAHQAAMEPVRAALETQRRSQQSLVDAGALDRLDLLATRVELAANELALFEARYKVEQAFLTWLDASQVGPLAAPSDAAKPITPQQTKP